MADLEQAIEIMRETIDETAVDDPQYARIVGDLGNHLGQKYLRTEAIVDLEEAITVTQKAIKWTPEDDPDRVVSLHMLGTLLGRKFSSTGAFSDLERSIQTAREVVKATPRDHPNSAGYLNNLANQLGQKYSYTNDITDLEEAIELGREVVDETPQGYPGKAGRLYNLSILLGFRYSRLGARKDLQELIVHLRSALLDIHAEAATRVQAGMQLLRYLALDSQWSQAYEASEDVLRILPQLTARSIQNSDRQHILSQIAGFSSDAAAVAIQAGQEPCVALNLLERGRGVLATSLKEMRIEVLDLEQKYPQLAKQFTHLRDELDPPVTQGSSKQSPESFSHAEATRRYEAGKEFDKLIIEIRKQPGFEDFLLAPSDREMQDAAKFGPIVIINVSEFRCDAILVEQHQMRSISLPHLESVELEQKIDSGTPGSPETLEWLWDAVANPILSALGLTRPSSFDYDWPRVWWIPTGALIKFPIHAAGYHSQKNSETVLDRVMSSYSSSVKTIIYSRQRPLKLSVSPQALLVAMERTPGSSTLPFAAEEIAVLKALCKPIGLTPIKTKQHTQNILSHLLQCQVFHFAGHGYTDEDNPSNSCLLLEDGKTNPLTVAALLRINLYKHSPFLAYLSACGTSELNDAKFADESINLVSAFQIAGFRHVIGTLWEVNDELCVDMARITYEGIRDRGMADKSVCWGLHVATRELRDSWLSIKATTKHESKSIELKGTLSFKETTGAQGAGDKHRGENARPRDIVLCDGEDEKGKGSLLWVPYVHFGV